jgi:broad specificity phosphatase PhoE
MLPRLFLVRHGETEWSLSGRHTGSTDIPLTERGEQDAKALGPWLHPVAFSAVLTSPRRRARRTCDLAGLAIAAEIDPDLAEWDYGDFEGLTSAEIFEKRPAWNLFRDGCPHGESPSQVSDRADRFLVRVRTLEGNVAVFSHGHFGRVLAARWIGSPASLGQRLFLATASLSILGHEHGSADEPVLELWNERSRNRSA